MYNKVIMMGRIVNDLELRSTPAGASVLSFRIAVDRRFQTKEKTENPISSMLSHGVTRQNSFQDILQKDA